MTTILWEDSNFVENITYTMPEELDNILFHAWLSKKDIYPPFTINSKGFSQFLLLFRQGILFAWLFHDLKYHQINHYPMSCIKCFKLARFYYYMFHCSQVKIIRKAAPGTSQLSGNKRKKWIFTKRVSNSSRLCFSWGEHVMLNTYWRRKTIQKCYIFWVHSNSYRASGLCHPKLLIHNMPGLWRG